MKISDSNLKDKQNADSLGIFQASFDAELKFQKDQLQISQDNNRILHDKYLSLLNVHDKLKVDHKYL